jgi:hypothetical protein
MADLVIDRHVDHSRYSNERHTWVLPRRLRLDNAFRLEGGEGAPRNELVLRVTRHGLLAVPLRHDQANLALMAPDDTDAFRQALNPMFEWRPFDKNREQAPVARPRFGYSEPSDKGRYLLGVLGRFRGLREAFNSLMHGFWHDVLLNLGATPELSIPLRQELVTVLRRRLGQRVAISLSRRQNSRIGWAAKRFGSRRSFAASGASFDTRTSKRNGMPRSSSRFCGTILRPRVRTMAITGMSAGWRSSSSTSASARCCSKDANGDATPATIVIGLPSTT